MGWFRWLGWYKRSGWFGTSVAFGYKAAKSCAILSLGHKMADICREALAPLSCPTQLMEMEITSLCPSNLAESFILFRSLNEGN